MDSSGSESGAGLLGEILGAPDRERIPAARPLVSASEGDDPKFQAELEVRARSRVELRRRGVSHGSAVELEGPRAPWPTLGEVRRRWEAAQPIFLPGQAGRGLAEYDEEIDASLRLGEELGRPGTLGRWLRAQAEHLPAGLVVSPRRARLADPERDLEKVVLAPADARRPGAPRPLWLKSARLSEHPGDASVRLRCSYGREGADDADRDLARQRLVAEVAEALLPEARAVTADNAVLNLLESLAGEPVFFTQHIGYWNAPEGGALFHHDAFPGDEDGGGQLGVTFAQLAGRTLWLALPVAELAGRVRELAAYLADGQLPWVRQDLFPRAPDFDAFLRRVNDHRRLMRELALPGCGALGRVVNRGPEFTALLLDAGHGVLLEAGDVLILPNHGLGRTVMHSVFCASPGMTFGLSLAVRGSRPRPEPEAGPGGAGAPAAAPRPRRARRRKAPGPGDGA